MALECARTRITKTTTYETKLSHSSVLNATPVVVGQVTRAIVLTAKAVASQMMTNARTRWHSLPAPLELTLK